MRSVQNVFEVLIELIADTWDVCDLVAKFDASVVIHLIKGHDEASVVMHKIVALDVVDPLVDVRLVSLHLLVDSILLIVLKNLVELDFF